MPKAMSYVMQYMHYISMYVLGQEEVVLLIENQHTA